MHIQRAPVQLPSDAWAFLPVLRACINRGEFCKALSTSSEVKWGSGAEEENILLKEGNGKIQNILKKKKRAKKKFVVC